MVDVPGIPQRREERIGQPEGQQVLHSFLAEVVINTIDLLLAPALQKRRIERPGRGEIFAEGLLDDQPAAARQIGKARCRQLLVDHPEEVGGDGQVEQRIAGGSGMFAHLHHQFLEARIGRRIVEFAGRVVEPRLQPLPAGSIGRPAGGKLLHSLALRQTKLLVRQRLPRHADDGEILRQQAVAGEIVERRHQQAFGQITRGSQNHQQATGHHRSRGTTGIWLRLSLR